MIRGFHDVKCREIAEFFDDGTEECEIGESVARALQKQHGHSDFSEVIGTLGSGIVGRVKRKAEEDESANVRKQALRGSLRRHASAHGLSASEDREAGRGFISRAKSGGDGRGQYCRRIGAAAALLQVGKLVAQGGHSDRSKFDGEILHERVAYACAGAMGKKEQPACLVRPMENC